MAPEVALCHPYNHTVDTYSFAIVFWQICSLSIPFDGFTCKMHSDLVVHRQFRPALESSWPCTWKELMTQSWSHRISDRPGLDHIHTILSKEVEKIIHIEDYWESGEALPSLSSTLSTTSSCEAPDGQQLASDASVSDETNKDQPMESSSSVIVERNSVQPVESNSSNTSDDENWSSFSS